MDDDFKKDDLEVTEENYLEYPQDVHLISIPVIYKSNKEVGDRMEQVLRQELLKKGIKFKKY